MQSVMKKIPLRRLLRISRPHRWFYLFGSYVIGVIAGFANSTDLSDPTIWWYALFFTFPANLLLYGINDIYDYKEDKENPDKLVDDCVRPREHHFLFLIIFLTTSPFVLSSLTNDTLVNTALLSFFFLSVLYSIRPIQAKSKPFMDAIFSTMIVFPGVVGFALMQGVVEASFSITFAAILFVIGIHVLATYIDLDQTKKNRTTASYLGPKLSRVFVLLMIVNGTAIAALHSLVVAIPVGLLYLTFVWQKFRKKELDTKAGHKELHKINAIAIIMIVLLIIVEKFL